MSKVRRVDTKDEISLSKPGLGTDISSVKIAYLSMGEQPVYSTRAHVFQIDPSTKKSWLPCSKQAVTVSFYYDPNKETHRIISVDGAKAIVNSTIVPNMTFTKTSQKFGQWSDARANTVFGLGFPSEAELNKFADKFKEAKGSTRTAGSTSSGNSNSSATGVNAITTNGTSSGAVNGTTDSPLNTPSVGHKTSSLKSNSSASSGEEESKESSGISHKLIGNTESHLKYENDRLKMALAQSSANAKKWETELQTLKNNNARLTAALQESTTNVEEWKKQLNAYKEENIKLRKKVQELESSDQVSERFNVVQQEKLTLDGRVIQLESMIRQKDEDMGNLIQSNAELTNQNQTLQMGNQTMQMKIEELTSQMSAAALDETRVQELTELQQELASKIEEMNLLNVRLAASLQTRPPAPES
ncbi:homer protein homolog 1-like [Orbicella faveolata]|uniref:homer protein homolog 1-like n=1 Tax=Orbicella faveolata TaxID=48498 RepID=UPI0009E269B8|nr:homer protein homolog 1-like [Orbicella faveolata]